MKGALGQALNDQIKEELFSAYTYMAMEVYAESINLPGFANWFYIQSKEEMEHANGMHKYLISRDAKVEYQAIAKPPVDFKSALHLFEETLTHEKYISKKVNGLYELAIKEKDYAMQSFLRWYIDEQVEEEAQVKEIIEKIKLAGEEAQALYMIDRELANRQYIPAKKPE